MIRIVSHNINGINAYKNNGKLDNILKLNADIYCFQELKKADIIEVEKILKGTPFENYIKHYELSTFKKGYAGVMTLINPNINIINEHHPELEENIILENLSGYGSGRIVVSEFDNFYIVNVYVINSGNKENDRIQWDKNFIEYLKTLDKPYIICGDMNVCATEKDYYGNYESAINSSPGLMDFEINDFDVLVKTLNLTDSYRYLYPNNRKYTWLSPMAKNKSNGWRLDYFLLHESLKENIINSLIFENWQKNDHMPIMLEINI